MVPLPPPLENRVSPLSAKSHGASRSVSVTVTPAIANVATRGPALFRATANLTVPSPVPLAPPMIVTNVPSTTAAVHVHR